MKLAAPHSCSLATARTAIIDRATYEQPTLLSEGVRHVLVNGRFALRDGQVTGEKAGRVLRRAADLPSRPMRIQQPRSLAVTARDFSFNLTQTANGKPRGSVRFRDPKSGTEFRMIEAGLLQTYDKWASFTARVRTRDNTAEQIALVVLDGGNPMLTQATIRVELSDGRRIEATLKPHEFKVGNSR